MQRANCKVIHRFSNAQESGERVWAPNFYVVQGSIVYQAITKKQGISVERIRIGEQNQAGF